MKKILEKYFSLLFDKKVLGKKKSGFQSYCGLSASLHPYTSHTFFAECVSPACIVWNDPDLHQTEEADESLLSGLVCQDHGGYISQEVEHTGAS